MDKLLRVILPLLLTSGLGAAESKPPRGWKAIQDGNPNSRFTGEPKKWRECRMEVHSGGLLGLKKDVNEEFVLMSARVGDAPDVAGASGGVYLHTKDGALLKLERCWSAKGGLIRFSASAGKESFGQKEIPLPGKTPVLTLRRKKDTFEGTVASAAGKQVSVASLKWPGLAKEGTAGILATYYPEGASGPGRNFAFDDVELATLSSLAANANTSINFGALSAKDTIQKGFDAFGEHELLYDSLARLHDMNGDAEGMEKALRNVLRLAPDHWRALNRLGYDLIERGVKLEEALSLTQKAASLAPDKAFVVDSLGWGYYRLGKYPDARRELERATGLIRKRGKIEGHEIVIFEHLGEVYHVQRDTVSERKLYEGVITLIRETVKSTKYENGYIVAGIAWMQYKLGRLPEARKEMERAVEKLKNHAMYDKADTEIHERMGDIYLACEDEAKAAAAYKRAFDNAKRFHMQRDKKRIGKEIQKLFE